MIQFDFDYHYFAITDQNFANVFSGLALTVDGKNATACTQSGCAFYFDTFVYAPIQIKVTSASDSQAVLYTAFITPTTFNQLILNTVIKFVTDFTVPTIISGAGINSSCMGICYVQPAFLNSPLAISANGVIYTINVQPTFT